MTQYLRPVRELSIRSTLRLLMFAVFSSCLLATSRAEENWLQWSELPSLPNAIGVAGPVVGVHNNALIVAGGANFPPPVWEHDKQWLDEIYVLVRQQHSVPRVAMTATSKPEMFDQWTRVGSLPRPCAYAACASTSHGIVVLGGNNADGVSQQAHLMCWDGQKIRIESLPNLPSPNVYGQAAWIGSKIYLIAGQTEDGLDTCTSQMWSFDLDAWTQNRNSTGNSASNASPADVTWQAEPSLPAASRAFHMAAVQHDGFFSSIYIYGGRRAEAGETQFLNDTWQYIPELRVWRPRRDLPSEMMAGTAIGFGQSHVFVLGAATSTHFFDVDRLRDNHPGFPRQAYAYHTITDRWTSAGNTPLCQVTTTAVIWQGDIIIPSGEVRPRVRTPNVYRITPVARERSFGWLNYFVLFTYLLSMVGVGIFFAKKNNNTEQYFRGGQSIPWWAAGCSIFATMLSSLTYTGIPSKAFAQDWVYSIGNFMIPVVAIVAVYVALPFFRRIDATSAYEYLEKRFNRPVRYFASLSFTLFHIFRMAVVMSLTGLALAVATPLTPTQSVILMGLLSIVYCTMGGIEAVIWTDTLQTFVLLGGALIAFVLLISGVDGGLSGFFSISSSAGKWNAVNWHWDATSNQIALWVIVLGGVGQNLASYTADQAVVQRYMTTSDQHLAARSIWTNALLTIPATCLFFGIGTALFAYYQSHPEKLDPNITTDQILPLFISQEMPLGLAGLLVAGIFAAAQSTVSTSMNSTATTIVTDLLKPLNILRSDHSYMTAARLCTLILGMLGTGLALVFIDPNIRSLFDQFIKVIGLFMGVLGGLFMLGAMTRRANGGGAIIGAIAGCLAMYLLWTQTAVNGYLYTAVGIVTCFVSGYLASFLFRTDCDHTGLTIWSSKQVADIQSSR